MKPLIVSVLLTLPAISQPGRGPAVRSPEVGADGAITFRLRAPDAKDVAVTGIGQRLAMTKDDKGVWSATTSPQKSDIYTYSFAVDGARVVDPGNPLLQTAYGSVGESMVRVPGHEVWDPADGPHGAVTHHFY